MNDLFTNPFHATRDAERAGLWEMLVARDNDAFAAADWGPVADDFASDRFEGISANGSADPASWTLAYPTVDAYRVDWLRMADEFLLKPLVEGDHRALLYLMTTLARIDIVGDRAAVWKQFRANARLRDGGVLRIAAQSLFRLHRIDGRWMIVGFVGYLPLEVAQ